MKHYNVVIATPGRMFHSEYVQSLVKTLEALTAEGLTYTFLNKYSSFVPTARELTAIDRWDHNYDSNEIAEGKFTYDKLFWIDSDVEWDPEDFLALYKSELEIVSGLYAIDQYGKLAVGYPNEHVAKAPSEDMLQPSLSTGVGLVINGLELLEKNELRKSGNYIIEQPVAETEIEQKFEEEVPPVKAPKAKERGVGFLQRFKEFFETEED
jgi:hypothetical protein